MGRTELTAPHVSGSVSCCQNSRGDAHSQLEGPASARAQAWFSELTALLAQFYSF